MDIGYVRKCVDSDFVDALIAVLLGDDFNYAYRIYNVDDWYIFHVAIPGVGGDWALVIKITDGELEECWYLEAD